MAESYSNWQWNGRRYVESGLSNWSPPVSTCPASGRPDYPNDWCAIPPEVSNIEVNKSNLQNNPDYMHLTFNTDVNVQQLPLVMYKIDWGDGNETVVSSVEMRDKPSENDPHSVYHLYSYWDIESKESQLPHASCDTSAGVCEVTIRIKIKDNWDWYNGCTSIGDCDSWETIDINVSK